jgi:thiol-disulfide isomerase/thioredoxin
LLSIAQNSVVKGKLTPKEEQHNSLVIYQMKGSELEFINYGQISEDGSFSIDIPEDCMAGMYLLKFSYGRNGFIRFIFNHSDIELNIDTKNPSENISFINSEENKLYLSFLKSSKNFNKKIDSIAALYIKSNSQKDKRNYKKLVKKYLEFNAEKINEAEGMIAVDYFKAAQKYHTNEPATNQKEKLENEKKYFFHYIDFNNEGLINSPILLRSAIKYILSTGQPKNLKEEENLLIENINQVLAMASNMTVKSDMITELIYVFTNQENKKVVQHLLAQHYYQLPADIQDKELIKNTQSKLSVAIGEVAPNFKWVEKGVQKELKSINKANNYILVFWSTTCSHCEKQIPKLYEFTKDRKDVHVISYALENEKNEFKKYEQQFTGWTNILGLEKWENPVAIKYQIDATPTYIVLDSDKKIIGKPYGIKELKEFLEK